MFAKTLINAAINITCSRLPALNLIQRNFHLLQLKPLTQAFLRPEILSTTPACGFKIKGKLNRRCKDCFFVKREGRWFIICKTHPRHKQMQLVRHDKKTWMLTHATQGPARTW